MAIEEGSFLSRACSPVKWIESKGGNPGADVWVEFLDGANKGQRMHWQGWLGDRTQDRTFESLREMGYDGETDDSLHEEFVSVVENETNEYEGKTFVRPRIKWINSKSRGANFKLLDAAGIANAKARYRAYLSAQKKPGAAMASPAADVPEWAR